jgi:hypothetical protein
MVPEPFVLSCMRTAPSSTATSITAPRKNVRVRRIKGISSMKDLLRILSPHGRLGSEPRIRRLLNEHRVRLKSKSETGKLLMRVAGKLRKIGVSPRKTNEKKRRRNTTSIIRIPGNLVGTGRPIRSERIVSFVSRQTSGPKTRGHSHNEPNSDRLRPPLDRQRLRPDS